MINLMYELDNLKVNFNQMSEDQLDGLFEDILKCRKYTAKMLRIARFHQLMELTDALESMEGFFLEVEKEFPGTDKVTAVAETGETEEE